MASLAALALAGATEAEFQNAVVAEATARGWLVMHSRPSLTKSGRWRTAIQGHKGFPDLVMARDGVIVFAELKSASGRLSPDQKAWLRVLDIAARIAPSVVVVDVFRPADYDRLVAILA